MLFTLNLVEPEFDPVEINIICETLEELQEFEIRMHLYMSDLEKVRGESCSKLPKGSSHMHGIMELRQQLHNRLGKQSTIF